MKDVAPSERCFHSLDRQSRVSPGAGNDFADIAMMCGNFILTAAVGIFQAPTRPLVPRAGRPDS
jgi:hypothetical protein